MEIEIGQMYRYKGKDFTMRPYLIPLFVANTGILCTLYYPESWDLSMREEIIEFDHFKVNYMR